MTKPVKFEAHVLARQEWARRWLRARTVEEGECVIWQGAVNSNGSPNATIQGQGGTGVRPWIYRALVGAILADHEVIATCGNPMCLNPAHLKAVPRRERMKCLAAAGVWRRPDVRARITAARRARSSFSMEEARQVRAMRAQGMTRAAVCAAMGISKWSVTEICMGRAWREGGGGSSVFNLGGLAA